MATVTQTVKATKQPRGGYIKRTDFHVDYIEDDIPMYLDENMSPATVGLVVDYLSRFMIEGNVINAFDISLKGYTVAKNLELFDNDKYISFLLANIVKDYLSDNAIISACKLVNFDAIYRAMYLNIGEGLKKEADKSTIENIKIMLNRCKQFFDMYKPIKFGFTFEPDGYTSKVTSGDGDFLSSDTLWDMKVSKNEPNKDWTLQVLMYYLMGKHSGQEIYNNISHIGIFNPRLGKIYRLNVSQIDKQIIDTVENDIIGY